jgi:hypothetical protein
MADKLLRDGIITAAVYDSRGILHVNIRKMLIGHSLWTTGDAAEVLHAHWMENSMIQWEGTERVWSSYATPVTVRYNNVTNEISEVYIIAE